MSPNLYAIQLYTETRDGRQPVVGADVLQMGITTQHALELAIQDKKLEGFTGAFIAEVTNVSNKVHFYQEVTIE